MHGGRRRAIARGPGFFRGEAQHRRQPHHRAAEQMVEHGEAGLARRRRVRIAIERVLADVEIKRRQVRRHEGRQRGEDALVVEIGIGLAHQRVEFRKPMQHQPLQLRHLLEFDALVFVEMREIAEHPAHGVAQLAVGVDRGLEDFRADAQIVGVVRGADPHAQDVGARLLDHVLRRGDVAGRLRHLAALLVEHEAVREHHVEGRAAARAARFQQRGVEPATVLVAAFEIHHGVFAAVGLALDAGERREMNRVFKHEGVRRAGIEPDVENVVDFLPAVIGELAEETFARARLVPGVGAFGLEGLDDADLDFGILQDLDRAVRLFLDEHRDRHAPGALARDHPIGPRLDHAGDAVLARPPAPNA